MPSSSRERKTCVLRSALRFACYFVWLAVVLTIENPGPVRHLAAEIGLLDPATREDTSDWFEPLWYQVISRAGYRPIKARHVRIVSLTNATEEGDEELRNNICKQRARLAELVAALDQLKVGLIVIDKYFGRKSCPTSDAGTAALLEALRNAGSPVVVGLSTKDPDQWGHLTLHNSLLLDAELGDRRHILFGLVRLNQDNRKIPLEWSVTTPESLPHSDESQPNARREKALAMVAAQLWHSDVDERPTLRQLLANQTHPYASFIEAKDFYSFWAKDVICEASDQRKAAGECKSGGLDARHLANHIALVGDDMESDRHSSVIGVVPGMVLQANYIEALLDDRYFTPIDQRWSVAVLLVFSALLYFLFSWMDSPEIAAILGVSALALLGLVSYVLIVHWGCILLSSAYAGGLCVFLILRWLDCRQPRPEHAR